MQRLRLFSSVKFTNGSTQALLADLQRDQYCLVPSKCHSFFDADQDLIAYNSDGGSASDFEYFCTFLLQNELAFEDDEVISGKFITMSNDFLFPAILTNAIFELSNRTIKYFETFVNVISIQLCTRHLQVRIHPDICLEQWKKQLKFLEDADIFTYELLFTRLSIKETKELRLFVKKCNRLASVLIYGAQSNKNIFVGNVLLQWSTHKFGSELCGCISNNLFSVNVMHYTEGLQFNTCLNRKISIDVNGEIKNCPSMAKSYGNIKDTKLIDVANDPEFQKVWYINKDQIKVCRDCEFRYICTDCRAYLEDPQDLYSKPLKCGYNPYTCEWEEWSTNPLKQMAIDHYGMREILPKKEN